MCADARGVGATYVNGTEAKTFEKFDGPADDDSWELLTKIQQEYQNTMDAYRKMIIARKGHVWSEDEDAYVTDDKYEDEVKEAGKFKFDMAKGGDGVERTIL